MRLALCVSLCGVFLPSHSGAQEQPPATQPAQPALDQLLDQLSKINPDQLKAHLAKLQGEHKQALERSAQLRAQLQQTEAQAAAIKRRIDLINLLLAGIANAANPAPPPPADAKPVAPAPAAEPAAPPPVAKNDSPMPAAATPVPEQQAAPPAPQPAQPAMAAAMPEKQMPSPPPPPPEAAKPPAPAPAQNKPDPAPSNAMKENATPPASGSPTASGPPPVALLNYETHVKPIFIANCVGCHNQDEARGGLVLDVYDLVILGGSSGETITPGDPDASRLWRLVSHQEKPNMPLEQPRLPDNVLETIRTWIAQGALPDANAKPPAAQPEQPTPPDAANAEAEPAPVAAASGRTLPMPSGAPHDLTPATSRPVAAIALATSPVAPLVAVCGSRQIVLYHSEAHELLAALPFAEGRVEQLQFSPDGEWLLAAGGDAERSGLFVVFDVRTGRRLFEIGGVYDSVRAAAIDPYRELVAYGGSNKIVRVYDLFTNEPGYELRKHNDWITAAAFSPDATLLATADRAGNLFVWEAATGRPLHTLRGHGDAIHDLAFSPDSNTLASGGEDRTIRLWNMDSGKQAKRIAAHDGAVLTLHYARDGRLVSGGADHRVKLWKPDGAALKTLEVLDDWVYTVAFDRTAERVFAGTWSGRIVVFDVMANKRLREFDTNARSSQQVALNAAATR